MKFDMNSDGEYRRKTEYAWLPVIAECGSVIWLRNYDATYWRPFAPIAGPWKRVRIRVLAKQAEVQRDN